MKTLNLARQILQELRSSILYLVQPSYNMYVRVCRIRLHQRHQRHLPRQRHLPHLRPNHHPVRAADHSTLKLLKTESHVVQFVIATQLISTAEVQVKLQQVKQIGITIN